MSRVPYRLRYAARQALYVIMLYIICYVFRGFVRYNIEVHKFRAYASLNYTHCGFQVRSITTHIDESCVKLHWRLYYQSQWRLLKFWTFDPKAPAEEKYE